MRPGRIGGRTAAAVAVAGGAAAGLALERRHLRSLARDPDYARLTASVHGRPVTALSADGTSLHAEVLGPDDGPTLVLAHGWTEQLSYWGPVAERLTAKDLRVVAYDLRGHGASGPAKDGDYALQRFGEDVEAVLAATLADGQRATVVGHSLGAMSIAAWAKDHDVQARANAAALLNTGLGDLIAGHVLFGELAKALQKSPWAGRALLGSRAPLPPFSSPVSHAVIRYAAFGPTATAADVAFFERMMMACPAGVRAASGVAMSDMNLWDAVARLTVPTLVIAGSGDRLTPPAHARRIAKALPDLAGLLELPETGHMSPLERPDEVAAALAQLASAATGTLPRPETPAPLAEWGP